MLLGRYWQLVPLSLFIAFPIVRILLSEKTKTELPPATISDSNNSIALKEIENAQNPTLGGYINLSVLYLNNKLPDKAITALQSARKISDTNAVIYNNLAIAYGSKMNYDSAIFFCRKAIQIDPSFQMAKNNLKWLVDENEKAASKLNEFAEKIDSKSVNEIINYGLEFYSSGDYNKAIELWSEALKKDKNNSLVMNNIGSALIQLKRYDEAIVIITKAISAEPENQLYKNNLKWALNEKSALR
jgi:tetratricopeptide (TPR) repeat protein